jgi:hypothetical protein
VNHLTDSRTREAHTAESIELSRLLFAVGFVCLLAGFVLGVAFAP